jgi:hypothetical protein
MLTPPVVLGTTELWPSESVAAGPGVPGGVGSVGLVTTFVPPGANVPPGTVTGAGVGVEVVPLPTTDGGALGVTGACTGLSAGVCVAAVLGSPAPDGVAGFGAPVAVPGVSTCATAASAAGTAGAADAGSADVLGAPTESAVGALPPTSSPTGAAALAVGSAGGTGLLTRISDGSTAGGVSGSKGGGSVGCRTWSRIDCEDSDDESPGLLPIGSVEMLGSGPLDCAAAAQGSCASTSAKSAHPDTVPIEAEID